jgi:pimeloyl-ACP methyl ester carboxylesterase
VNTVTSSDGTRLALETSGDGPPLIIVDGALASREVGPSRKLATELSRQFTIYRYDRRGRGQSSDAPSYSVQREIEDIHALIEHAGGTASLVGISSGGVLALDAASHGLAVTKLVVYEAPFIVDDSRAPFPPDYKQQLERLLSAEQVGGAVKLFMGQVGLPRLLIAAMPLFPGWQRLKAAAPTLAYDAAIMGATQRGGPLPTDRWSAVEMPTLVADGAKSAGWLHRASDALAEVLPNATRRTVSGANHMMQADRVAPELTAFLTGSSTNRAQIGARA